MWLCRVSEHEPAWTHEWNSEVSQPHERHLEAANNVGFRVLIRTCCMTGECT